MVCFMGVELVLEGYCCFLLDVLIFNVMFVVLLLFRVKSEGLVGFGELFIVMLVFVVYV